MNRKYLNERVKRRSSDQSISRNNLRNIDDPSHKLPNPHASDSRRHIHKKYLSYKVLLHKIAEDLRKLKLNQKFHCTHNRSVKIFFRSLLLFFGWLLLY